VCNSQEVSYSAIRKRLTNVSRPIWPSNNYRGGVFGLYLL
jgi:hypothetical protein